MPKAASPVRLQQDLMQAASLTGERFHRSTAEQVEYWADIGRRVTGILDPDVLLSVISGLAKIMVEPVHRQPVDPNAVFASLENKRQQQTLSRDVTSAALSYQASSSHPGYLEQIDANGHTTIGQFQSGQFIPLNQD